MRCRACAGRIAATAASASLAVKHCEVTRAGVAGAGSTEATADPVSQMAGWWLTDALKAAPESMSVKSTADPVFRTVGDNSLGSTCESHTVARSTLVSTPLTRFSEAVDFSPASSGPVTVSGGAGSGQG